MALAELVPLAIQPQRLHGFLRTVPVMVPRKEVDGREDILWFWGSMQQKPKVSLPLLQDSYRATPFPTHMLLTQTSVRSSMTQWLCTEKSSGAR